MNDIAQMLQNISDQALAAGAVVALGIFIAAVLVYAVALSGLRR